MSNKATEAILKALGKSGGLATVVNRPAPVTVVPVSTPDEQPVAACEPEQQDQQPQSDDVADDRIDIVDADQVDDQIEDSPAIAAGVAEVLDNYRHDVDRAAGRGYDYDQTAPSHAEFIERQRVAEQQRRDLERQQVAQHHERVAETHLRLDRLATPQSASDLRAKELIRICREHGIGLRLDPDGALVVVSNGAAWRALVAELELHVDQIAALLISGWDPTNA